MEAIRRTSHRVLSSKYVVYVTACVKFSYLKCVAKLVSCVGKLVSCADFKAILTPFSEAI